eukprot:CAMPEP_0197634600 /NCGR_PEP_ID=MMETSP1338-20131121/10646_1 /TAXON_ID=43686 ORGANISM="Pelagodinium beii, Strain RCC1491" /NCGR_SAMPLE_ID=MMETSP1338 /ASSEMBLY_ACC=CAM_ASM_000754 /LENGTH=308 /DNA_ID=CAMNT_0043206491 /DNA_START=27 /DNA_END=950 /DNA_ORIENTATION=+
MGSTCGKSSGDRVQTKKFKNSPARGDGGSLVKAKGQTVCLVVCFDYAGYPALEKSGCTELTSSTDGMRFASLAKASGAKVSAYCDQSDFPGNQGFPSKETIKGELSRLGKELGPDDCFVFFFAGHGDRSKDKEGDEQDGFDEELCFVEPDGSYNPMRDDDISRILQNDFKAGTRILFITDCCHCGTVCDLGRGEFQARPIVHMGAVTDAQLAKDTGSGGAFTSSLVATIESTLQQSKTVFSVAFVYNECFSAHSGKFKDQDFQLEVTPGCDPDTFQWPLVPPAGWSVKTALNTDYESIRKSKKSLLDW